MMRRMELIAEREDRIHIIRIRNTVDGLPWRAPFAGAYQDVWSEPPYNEDFTPDEAASVLRRALETPDNITLLGVNEARVVLGFGVAVPVTSRPDVVREIRGLLPIDHTSYFAELGVLERVRNRGLGRQLIQLRLDLLDRRRFTHAVLRTSATRNATYDLYRELGFEDAGVYMEVPSRRVDGRTRTDRRLFMAKVL
jgi:ribosomal protein S18 acetylase RimI-like enzyme